MKSSKAKLISITVMLLASALVHTNLTSATADVAVAQFPLSSGVGTTCALRDNNTVYCAGLNDKGQLGDGTTLSSSEPVSVGLSGAQQVTNSSSSACAIGSDGFGYCWGDNSKGQLGNPLTSSTPRPISLAKQLLLIDGGGNYFCAVTKDFELYCWGNLGEGSDPKYNNATPTKISELQDVHGVSVGATGVCAITGQQSNSNLYCFGGLVTSLLPKAIDGSGGVTATSVGSDFACFIVSGGVKCFGDNSQGQLGVGNAQSQAGVVEVLGLSEISSVSAGDRFACALSKTSTTYCWGDNSKSQITSGTTDQLMRVPVSISNAVFISAGYGFVCGLLKDSSIKCLGDNTFGQSAVLASSVTPLAAKTHTGYLKVSSGSNTTCVLKFDFSLVCFGVLVPEITNEKFLDIAVGDTSACALGPGLTGVFCWGANGSGQLGDNTNKSSSVPVHVQGIGETAVINNISAGLRHFCAQSHDGLVYCWGDNSKDQLGYTGVSSKVAVPVSGIGNASGIWSGDYHNCATVNGSAVCWGDNSKKQIQNSVLQKLPATDTGLGSTVTKLALGSGNTCALFQDGKINCFGDNTESQSPGVLAGTYKDVSAFGKTVCATKSADNQVVCFGSNSNNKLGRVGLKSATPVDIVGVQAFSLNSDSLSVGLEHVCVLAAQTQHFDGTTLTCWGLNDKGQLGSSFGYGSAFADPKLYLSGKTNVGESLSAQFASLEPGVSTTITWSRSTSSYGSYASISNSNNSKRILESVDLNKFYRATVVLGKWGATSKIYKSLNTLGPIAAPIRLLITPQPVISGKTKMGSILHVVVGRWDAGTVTSIQWYRGSSAIKGATKITYKLTSTDVGKQISVAISGVKPGLPKVTMKSLKSAKVVR